MNDFDPYITMDGSVGLYNEEFDDIYHSVDGAITEAYEKFIYPVDFNILLSKKEIRVLDICYGIGYNSKSFLNFLLEKKYFKNSNIEAVYTDKNLLKRYANNNEPIHTNNILNNLYIKAVDNDKFLFFISPFIKSGLKFKNLKKINKIYKNYVKISKKIKKIKINKLINFLIFNKITRKCPEIFNDRQFNSILFKNGFNHIFSKELKAYFSYLKTQHSKIDKEHSLLSNLHNIYYKYITKWYKWRMKSYNFPSIDFEPVIDDARNVIKVDKNTYNLIFLDAFTPSKCPCLWSYDFIKVLYDHIDDDGLLLTYSSAAPVRNAMICAGFYIGYIFNKRTGKYVGTVASKNKALIKYPLSEFDLGLLNTKAGIFYRDENLTASNEAIISRREKEFENSNKISSTAYKSRFSNN